jgi:hypothetical protein
MTITRPDIRRAMLDEDVWRNVGYYTLTTATVRSVTGPFGEGGDSIAKFANRFIYHPASTSTLDLVRRVRSFTPERRTLFHEGPDYGGDTPIAGDVVELHSYHPDMIERAIERALTRRCFTAQRDDIETTGASVYTIGTVPFDVLSTITDPDDQIVDVEQVYGSGDTLRVEPWATGGSTFRGELDNGALAVRFDPAPSGTIRVIWKKPYTALATEAATSTCPLQYAMWASFYELYIALEEQANNSSEAQAQYSRMKLSMEERYMREHRLALGQYAFRIRRQRRAHAYHPSPSHTLRG